MMLENVSFQAVCGQPRMSETPIFHWMRCCSLIITHIIFGLGEKGVGVGENVCKLDHNILEKKIAVSLKEGWWVGVGVGVAGARTSVIG